MSGGAGIQLHEVAKQYASGFQLRVSRLSIDRGEILALIGPTGAGKSTLLRLLAGLQTPDSGQLELDGTPYDAGGMSLERRRRLAFVDQRPRLITGTLRYNIEYGLRLRRFREIETRVEPIIKHFDLQPLAAQPAHSLSGGQAQLVALARAMVLRPDVLLLDEPTAHLDPGNVARVEESIMSLRRESGMTVVWATHNLFQARRVASRIALMLDGDLIEIASTDQFFDSPRDVRTRDFVQGRIIY
jgi:tungstate transport system ATP-binding protein